MPHNKYLHTRDHPWYATSDHIIATSNDCCDVTNLLRQSYLSFIKGIKELQKNGFDHRRKTRSPKVSWERQILLWTCERVQIQGIVNIKDDIKKWWVNSGHSDEKYSKRRKVGSGDLDGFMWDWFTVARSKMFLSVDAWYRNGWLCTRRRSDTETLQVQMAGSIVGSNGLTKKLIRRSYWCWHHCHRRLKEVVAVNMWWVRDKRYFKRR